MITKTVTYEDLNGKKHTQTLNFHLTKAEAIEFFAEIRDVLRVPYIGTRPTTEADVAAAITNVDSTTLVAIIRKLIVKAYGVRSEDGASFMKPAGLAEAFPASPAYSELFCELVTNPDDAQAFFRALVPKDVAGPAS